MILGKSSLLAQDRCEVAGETPEEATKVIWGLEHLLWKRAERAGLFSLGKRTLQGDFIVTFESLKRASKKDHHDL